MIAPRSASAMLFALLLGGCTGVGGIDTGAQRVPPDAKAVILANKAKLWKDPDSIKTASIAAPQPHMGFMWHVCVRLNAKNSLGGYTGEKSNIVAIYDDGRAPELLGENMELNCGRQPHVPFPELDGRRNPAS